MPRHARQVRLTEVGAEGQTRLARARVSVSLTGFTGDVAVRYLAGAGVGALRVGDPALAVAAGNVDPQVAVEVVRAEDRAEPEAFDLVDERARALASGSLYALRAIRRVLDEAAGT